jgi:putative nucleotidyltransferase with HDIG domain
MASMIERVREIVKKECGELFWEYHILVVVKYAKLLANKLNADEELAELGALLHDIGRIKFGEKNHEITGIPEAEMILKGLNYPPKVIDEIKHCVQSHRGSKDVTPKTITAKIVANADAMAHFDAFPALIQFALDRESNPEKALGWIYEKLKRDWNKKLTIPEAREMIKEKYKEIQQLFDFTKESPT